MGWILAMQHDRTVRVFDALTIAIVLVVIVLALFKAIGSQRCIEQCSPQQADLGWLPPLRCECRDAR